MPKIKFNGQNSSYTNEMPARKGLRSEPEHDDVYIPRTQREKEEYFDLYRTDVRKKEHARPRPKSRTQPEGRFQLWYAACLISALGMFCILADAVIVSADGISIGMDGLSIIASMSKSSRIPAYITYMSFIPLVFGAMFGTFVLLKEKAFDRASLVLIAASVFIIAVQCYWSKELMELGNWEIGYTPGLGIIVEIGCSIALLVVIICQRVLSGGLLTEVSFINHR